MVIDTGSLATRLGDRSLVTVAGRVTRVTGLVSEAQGLSAPIGALCRVARREAAPLFAELVGFREGRALLMPLGDLMGIGPGDRIWSAGPTTRVPVGRALLGRVLGPLGEPLDGKGRLRAEAEVAPPQTAATRHVPAAHPSPPGHRRARAGRPAHLRAGPARGDLRRERRGEEHAARHDRSWHDGGRQRHRLGGRAGPRGAGVHSEGPGPGGAGPLRRGRRHLGRSTLAAPAGGVPGHQRGGVLPRPGPGGPPHDGFVDAIRHGPARNRSGGG